VDLRERNLAVRSMDYLSVVLIAERITRQTSKEAKK
jgi:hypothetical protein